MVFDLADLLSIGELALMALSVEPIPSDSELRSDSDASAANNIRFSNSFPGEPFLPWPYPSRQQSYYPLLTSSFSLLGFPSKLPMRLGAICCNMS